MSDGGKGSSPRPFSIAHEEYSKRWDAIFQRDIKEETDSEEKKDEEKSGDQSNWENTSLARLSQRFESVILHQLAPLVKWHNYGLVIRNWQFDSVTEHQLYAGKPKVGRQPSKLR